MGDSPQSTSANDQSSQKPPVEPTDQELRLAQYLLDHPLETYAPTEAQQRFLALRSFIQVFSGANWCGKTAIGAAKLAAYLFGTQNQFFDYAHFNELPSKFRFRIISTHTAIEHAIVPEVKKWFPKGRFTTSKGSRTFDSRILCDTGSQGDLMTLDQSPEEFESVKLDLVWFDEPPPYNIYAATVARMRPNGIIMFTMTPLSNAGWLFDKAASPWANKSWGIVYADIESCCIQHGRNGYLDHEDIEKKIAEYDEEEKEARISGRPVHLSGLIFKTFRPDEHVIEPFSIPPDWTRYCVIDPHDRKPFAIIWAAVSPDGKVYVYDEWPQEPFHSIKSSSFVVSDYAQILREREGDCPATFRIIDARFGKKNSSQTGKSIRDMFDEEGLCFNDSYLDKGGSVDHGHQQVREYLKSGVDGHPSLQVFSTCANVIYSFQHYVWDEFRTDHRGPKEKPREAHKDFMDCVRYLLMEQPRYVSQTQETPFTPKWIRGSESGYGAVDEGY